MFKKIIIAGFLLAAPVTVAASCVSGGKTVVYINGIATSDTDASRELRDLYTSYIVRTGDSNTKFLNAYNSTTGSVIKQKDISKGLDGVGVGKQMLYWHDGTWNEDPKGDEILNQLHSDLTTQQVMLVGYSQGSMYANETYKYLTTRGLSTASVDNFDIATPASYVAGGGGYITSTNDYWVSVARRAVQNLGLGESKEPLPANVTIPVNTGDDTGHDFYTYLGGDPTDIVNGVVSGLQKLSPTSNTDTAECFTAPNNTTLYRAAVSFGNFGASLGTVENTAIVGFFNGALAAASSALDAASGFASGVRTTAVTTVGGFNGLWHASEPKYGNTNLKIEQSLYGMNQTVDGEDLHDLLNGNPSQGGAVILATVQDTNKPAPTPTTPSNNPTTPAVPVGPAPGFSPGGGGAAAPVVAADPAPQTQAAASVPVVDTMAPIISAVSNVSIEATSSDATFASVTYTTPTATDDVDGTVVVSCAPTSGSNFALGSTTVTCSAADTAGNTASTTFDVGVYLPPVSVPPPATEPVVINEIAWGGSFGAPSEQWVELYNNGSEDISLDDMVLSSADGAVYIPLSGAIAAHGYYILATSDNSIFNLKISGWNHGVNASLVLNLTPVQLILSRTNGSATTTLDQTPAADACGSAWCAGSLSSTNFAAAGGGNPMPVTMERVSASVSGSDSTNWSSADGYDRYAYDFNQQWIIGTPYNPNSSHWPMVGFVCQGDTGVLTPGNSYTYRPASNNCHYLSGYSNYNWSPEAVLLKGTIGSSTMVTQLSNNSGPYKNLQTDASHTYDFSNATSGDTFTVVFFEFNNNVGGQYNAYYLGDMHHYLETGFQNDGTTASSPYAYQSISFVIP